MTVPIPGSLLLVNHVPQVASADGEWGLDRQTVDGLHLWADHFASVTMAGPTVADQPSPDWAPARRGPNADRVALAQLPTAYSVSRFVRSLKPTIGLLRELIATHDSLVFAIGGTIGDWGVVAALLAERMGRAHAVWFDRVEDDVITVSLPERSRRYRIKAVAELPVMRRLHHRLTARADAALLQGADCYAEYAPSARRAALVYDSHIDERDMIGDDDVDAKRASVEAERPLRIVYSGRVAMMKGPLDWIESLAVARDHGVSFTATWYGDGPMMGEARARVVSRELESMVSFAGFVADRRELLTRCRAADIFLFCHRTRESPRNLIEAMASGLAVVGYRSDYATDITAGCPEDNLVPLGDRRSLGARLAALDRHRVELARSVAASAAAARRFDRVAVYTDRANAVLAGRSPDPA